MPRFVRLAGALAAAAACLVVPASADQAAQTSLTFSRRQLQLGQIGELAERGAEQAAAQASSARIVAQAARYTDAVALFQALGGGW